MFMEPFPGNALINPLRYKPFSVLSVTVDLLSQNTKSGMYKVFKCGKCQKLLNLISNGCLESGFDYIGRH